MPCTANFRRLSCPVPQPRHVPSLLPPPAQGGLDLNPGFLGSSDAATDGRAALVFGGKEPLVYVLSPRQPLVHGFVHAHESQAAPAAQTY